MNDEIGNRMKECYEDRFRFKLLRKTPVIMRLDGKAFHLLTKNMKKPFDDEFRFAMEETAKELLRSISGAKCCFVQSDEISVLISDLDRNTTQAWFDYNIQKLCSVASAIASVKFQRYYNGVFDCRVFNVPEAEVKSYFIWRQLDWERNSVQMFARSLFSDKELQDKKNPEMIEMMKEKGRDYYAVEDKWRYGSFITKTDVNYIKFNGETVIFTNLLKLEDDDEEEKKDGN